MAPRSRRITINPDPAFRRELAEAIVRHLFIPGSETATDGERIFLCKDNVVDDDTSPPAVSVADCLAYPPMCEDFAPAPYEWPEAAGAERRAAWADTLRAEEGLEPHEPLSNEAILEYARERAPDEVEAVEAEYEEAVIDFLAGEILDEVDVDTERDSHDDSDPFEFEDAW